MDERAVVDGSVGHHFQVAVLAGDGSQGRAGAQHHAHLIGGVHVDDAGGGGIDVIIVRARAQGIQLGLDGVDIALDGGQVGRNALQGGVVQVLNGALVLLHQGLDLLVRVTGRLVGGRVERVLCHLALVGLVLVVVGLVVNVRLAEVVLVVLNGLDQLLVLALLLFVEGQLVLVALGLNVQVGALDVGNEVALVDIAALGDVQFGDGAGVAGHDVGLVGSLHRAGGLADISAVVLGAPQQQVHHEEARQDDERVAVGRQLLVHHDAAVLQLVEIIDVGGVRHITWSP